MVQKLKSQHEYKVSALREMLRLLRRKKMLLFGITFLGFAITALFVQSIKPRYTAHAQIIFENKSSAFIKTQKAFISSPRIAQAVIRELRLMQRPEFNKGTKPAVLQASSFKSIDPYDTKLDEFSGTLIAKELEPAVKIFAEGLHSYTTPDSYVLNLEFTGEDPQLTARILNKIIEVYLRQIRQEEKEQIEQDFKHERQVLDRLKRNVVVAMDSLEQLKASLAKQQEQAAQTAASAEKPKASLNNEEAERRYKKAQAAIAPFMDSSGVIMMNEKAPAIINSSKIRKLNQDKANLQRELDSLSKRYGPKHPKIREFSARFSTIHTQIKKEKTRILEQARKEYHEAKAALSEDNAAPEPVTPIAEYSVSPEQIQEFNRLRDDAEEALRTYAEYEKAFSTSSAQARQIKNAEVLSRAGTPFVPSYPNKIRLLSLGTLVSFLLSIIVALLIEKARNTFLSGRQLEAILNIPCFALIPKAKHDRTKPLADYVLDNPSSSVAEAVRALRLTINLRGQSITSTRKKGTSKVVTITSSFPNEGKTTLASWMARLAAKSGERVILIDADLRRPSIHKSFGKENKMSLVEYLSGQYKLEEVIDTSDASGLHVMYGRAIPNTALDLVSSSKMEQLVRSLRKAYDLIIIDSPACMAVSDARALNKISDQLLYVVHWNKTAREVVHNGLSQFSVLGNDRIATVLTNINMKKHIQFGYGETINYYGHYKEYCAA